MPLLTAGTWGPVSHYLAGTYEDELHPHIERAIERKPAVVVVIGAAEGYYAVGMAKRLPEARIVAFEMDVVSRRRCAENAANSGVAIELRGKCDLQGLLPLLSEDTLVLCDCEGSELDLLDPGLLPGLSQSSLIVEVHDYVDPTISTTLERRFAGTHAIQWVPAAPKTPRHYPHLAHLPPRSVWEAIQEQRSCVMEWAVMEPLKRPGFGRGSRVPRVSPGQLA